MASVRINKRVLNFVINRYLDNSQNSFVAAARDRAENKMARVKRETLKAFDEHNVTKDIMGGARGSSVVLPFGNLFSFIGFDAGQQPAANLRRFLDNSLRLTGTRPRYNRETRIFNFGVNIPDRDQIIDATAEDTPEWGAFESWVYAVEDGISNLSHYLYNPRKTFDNSHSGPAIQMKKQIGGGDFSGTPYMTEILDFVNRQFN